MYWPVELRPAFDALFNIHDAMGEVVARATQPALAAIKLAWWRERLVELDSGKAPGEPRLRAAAEVLLPRGIDGAELAELADGWAGLLQDPPDVALFTQQGRRLFALGASLLGVPSDPRIDSAGELFARADAGRRGILDLQGSGAGPGAGRIEWKARPLTGLAALAARDLRAGPPFEPEGTPGRAMTLLKHRLSGRL